MARRGKILSNDIYFDKFTMSGSETQLEHYYYVKFPILQARSGKWHEVALRPVVLKHMNKTMKSQ